MLLLWNLIPANAKEALDNKFSTDCNSILIFYLYSRSTLGISIGFNFDVGCTCLLAEGAMLQDSQGIYRIEVRPRHLYNHHVIM